MRNGKPGREGGAGKGERDSEEHTAGSRRTNDCGYQQNHTMNSKTKKMSHEKALDELASATRLINLLKETNANLNRKLAQLEEDHDELQDRYSLKNSEANDMSVKIQDLQHEISTLNNEIEDLREDRDRCRDRHENLKDAAQDYLVSHAELYRRIA